MPINWYGMIGRVDIDMDTSIVSLTAAVVDHHG